MMLGRYFVPNTGLWSGKKIQRNYSVEWYVCIFEPTRASANQNQETCLNALKSMYEDEIDFSELWKMIDLTDSYEAAVPLSKAGL